MRSEAHLPPTRQQNPDDRAQISRSLTAREYRLKIHTDGD
jgi:hypothetical protein